MLDIACFQIINLSQINNAYFKSHIIVCYSYAPVIQFQIIKDQPKSSNFRLSRAKKANYGHGKILIG